MHKLSLLIYISSLLYLPLIYFVLK
ncbi:hypothetical protein Pint_17677 [Pistacia integerrima]|uniref:Uncharacterized protein n=1 Tax=Pistacia integerrima TaxID=434235 RepID=A0ACC0YWI7_9ROSI|nr:hypothetical protein Pint_17677 [Pistacia integerrima]